MLASVALLLALAASPPPPPAGGAAAGTLAGRVTDERGQPLDEVRVIVVEAHRSTGTNSDGRYRLDGLPPGTFGVAFDRIGYAPEVRRVTIGDSVVTLDVVMRATAVELPEVQTSASPLASTTLTSPQNVAVLGGRELTGALAPTLGETVAALPGLRSWSTGAGIGKPVIRGLGGNRVLTVEGGVRTETQQWGDEHGPNVEVADAARIEVIRGPQSVLYGSDALGGVVNVVPRDLPDAIGTRPAGRVRAILSYGSNNRSPDGTLILEGASGHVGARLTATGRTAQDVRTADGPLANSGLDAVNGSAAVGWRGQWGSVSATVTRRGERVEIHEDPADDPGATPFQRITDTRVRLAGMATLGGTSRLEVNLGWQRNLRREFEAAGDTEDDVAAGLDARQWLGEVHYHHAPIAGRVVGTIGVQASHSPFDRFGPERLIPVNRSTATGVFAFEEADVGRWHLAAGLRLDWRQLDVDSGFNGRETREILIPAQRRTWTALTGNLGALYRVSDPVAVVLNVGRGYRAPNPFELYAYGVHEGTQEFLIGTPTLANETSLTTDLALRVQSRLVRAEVGGYLTAVDRFIYSQPTDRFDDDPADPEASGLREFVSAQADARLWGVEASVDVHPREWLELIAGLDYTNATNTERGEPLPFIPPFRATYEVRLTSTRSRVLPWLSLGGETNARQSRPNPFELAPGVPVMDGYTLLRAGTGVVLPARSGVVTVDLVARNLLDARYVRWMSRFREYALDMGRNVVLRVSAEF